MKKIFLILIVMIIHSLFTDDQLYAQVLTPFPSGNHVIYASFGLDPAFVATLGYARSFHNSTFNKDIIIFTEIALPIKLDLYDYRYKLGGQASIYSFNRLDFSGVFALIARGTKNSIHNAISFGMDITFLLGYYRKRWFATGELGFDRAIFTYIDHSDWYKTYFYSDAKDGWYRNTAGSLHYGFRTGFSLSRIEITLRAGVQKSKSIIDPLVPFFGILGLNYRF